MLGKAAKDFIQEWKSIKSLDEILATIKRGKEYKKMLLEFSQMVVQSILVIFPMNFQMKSLINRVLNASANIITELL